jgi:hypothetical protein
MGKTVVFFEGKNRTRLKVFTGHWSCEGNAKEVHRDDAIGSASLLRFHREYFAARRAGDAARFLMRMC